MSEENYLWQAVFDYVKIALPLFVRSRQRGDRFQPAGMAGKSKKLQDYFVDEKVPRLKRAAVPLLCTEQDIIWVVGMRTDARFPARAGDEEGSLRPNLGRKMKRRIGEPELNKKLRRFSVSIPRFIN